MTIAARTWLRVHAGLMLSLRGSALSSRRRPSRVEGVAAMRACLLGVGGTACVDRVLFCWAEAMGLCAGALASMALRLGSDNIE
jgi:cyanate permease